MQSNAPELEPIDEPIQENYSQNLPQKDGEETKLETIQN